MFKLFPGSLSSVILTLLSFDIKFPKYHDESKGNGGYLDPKGGTPAKSVVYIATEYSTACRTCTKKEVYPTLIQSSVG